MRRTAIMIVAAGLMCPFAVSQGNKVDRLEKKLKALQREIDELKSAKDGRGNAGNASPWAIGGEYAELSKTVPVPQEGVGSAEGEKIKIGGRLDFEFYDSNANRKNLGSYAGNQFGLSNGADAFRIRRLQLGLDLEMIEDFVFHSTLTLDPVVRDQDEGAVDIDEAYVRFGNFARNVFGFEDPSHTFVQAGNFFRWERDFLNRMSASFSLAGTAFYRDEVTGIQIGGDFEEGFFYRLTIDNGSALSARDAGVGAARGAGGSAVGNSPMLHDNEQLGDLNNSKDVSVGLGFQSVLEDPNVQYGVAFSYREGRLSPTERAFLAGISPRYSGARQKRRIGVMARAEWDLEDVILGGNIEFWFAKDGNGDRDAWSLAPYVRIPLDGVYYQKRLFFTGVGFGYRVSQVHLSDGLANGATLLTSILDDRVMHTVSAWLDVTRNVDLRLELNNIDATNRSGSETEWLIQWGIRF